MFEMPLLISKEKINEILETREPKGKFLAKDGLIWVAIDNETGQGNREELQTFETALRWLSE